MRNKVSILREGPIFIDANIFVYHAAESKYTEYALNKTDKVRFPSF